MSSTERRIKDFLKSHGVEVYGLAGPDRLIGPPSLSPSYIMPKARSIVSFALPMDTDAIHAFLGKTNPAPHNLDQIRGNQGTYRLAAHLAGYIRSLGYDALEVASNNRYRRTPDVFATVPDFSHRFGAIAAGIAAQGWSGNVKCDEYGAAMYLGTVVTRAVLRSDPPRYAPRHYIDGQCAGCKMCVQGCVARMFGEEEEEYVLISGSLHPRGRRRGIDLCNAACFGLHSLSPDRKWTTWGTQWIQEWVGRVPDADNKASLRAAMLAKAATVGDSTPRFDLIRRIGADLHPREVIDAYVDQNPERLNEPDRFRLLENFARTLGVTRSGDIQDERVLTCGHCAMICGPTKAETARRFKALRNGGLVAPGPGGQAVVVPTFEEAQALRLKYMPGVRPSEMALDAAVSAMLWHKLYFGVEPRSLARGAMYRARLARAIRKRAPGHKDFGKTRKQRVFRTAAQPPA
ncbi:MAG: hypothetical protein ACLFOY_00575 [Desulfatibacillaceae bacterium]